MTRFGFFCPPFPGHANPMAVLARELSARGHDTVFLHQNDAGPLFSRLGAAFHPLWVAEPGRDLPAITRRMARGDSLSGILAIIEDLARSTDLICQHAPRAFRSLGVDAVVCDQLEPAGGLVARHLGIPCVSVANALPINAEPDVPPYFVGWSYAPGRVGRWRNRGARRIGQLIEHRRRRVVCTWSERWGLGRRRSAEDCLSDTAQVAQAVAGLDFPRKELPDCFVYAGPFREASRDAGAEAEWEPGIVYCSLGTLQDHRFDAFRKVAEACRQLRLRLVIGHAGGLPDDAARALPGEVTVLREAPQRAVLDSAAVAICHGGFNTVLDALAAGVPVLALPIAFEQPATAARLRRAGAGRIGSLKWPATRLAAALEALLADRRYRSAARRIGDEIVAAGGAGRAASIIEAAAT